MNNAKAIQAYLNPKSKQETFNMQEFEFAVKVELECGKLKAAKVTNNYPFLIMMIAPSHSSESLIYCKRIQVTKAESKIHEIIPNLGKLNKEKEILHLDLTNMETELNDSKREFPKRLEQVENILVLKKIEY